MNGLTLLQSNRLEALAERLAAELVAAKRRQFSFRPDVILVNNYEMAQWLAIKLAETEGVCANLRFRLLGSYVYELSGWLRPNDLSSGQQEAIGRTRLRWLIFGLLQELDSSSDYSAKESGLGELLDYARRFGPSGLYELSGQLADVFDRYLNYRYDMLKEWEEARSSSAFKESEVRWQAGLWRLLCERAGERFKAGYMVRLAKALMGQSEPGYADTGSGGRTIQGIGDILNALPETLYVFGVSYMPPLHMEVLHALSKVSQVQFYHLSACREYWADIVPERKRLGLERHYDQETLDRLFPVGNRLLASLGLAGRQFLMGFYGLDFAKGEEMAVGPGNKSLLNALQASVLEMKELEELSGDADGEAAALKVDDSIEIHSCHSRIREVEVLHDRLVDAFLKDKTLEPHHVAVMAPDISLYADFVEAVFGQAPDERRIPYTISDIGLERSSPWVSAFLSLLRVATGEFTAPEVVDLLGDPVVSKRLDLDGDALFSIRQWVRQSGIRRGIRTLSDGSRCQTNTWLFGLDRLMLTGIKDGDEITEMAPGYIAKPLERPIEGEGLGHVATLSAFVFGLERLRTRLLGAGGQGMSPGGWLDLLKGAISEFLAQEEEWNVELREELIYPLEDLFGDISQAGVDSIAFEAVLASIRDRFSSPPSHSTFITGKVLFSSLVPLRSLPFRVICLLGMNQGEFPRQSARPAYDLMARHPRPGDRIRRDEDRYLFLETLMSARERLIITYIGRRENDNQELDPSTVVTELVDSLTRALSRTGREVKREDLVTQHPLQPFGQGYLEAGDERLVTYAREWLPIDQHGKVISPSPVKPVAKWPSDFGHLLEEEQVLVQHVATEELISFLGHPLRFFMKNLLSINVDVGEEALDDHESYSLDYFSEIRMLEKMAEALGAGESIDASFFDRLFFGLTLEGLLPDNALARAIWNEKIKSELWPLLRRLGRDFCPEGQAGVDLTLDMHGEEAPFEVRVCGSAGKKKADGGLYELRPAMSEGMKICFWARHLLWCASSGCQEAGEGVFSTAKNDAVFIPVPFKYAREFSKDILELFFSGKKGLVPFWPKVSYQLAKSLQPKPRKAEVERWSPVGANEAGEEDIVYAIKKVLKDMENSERYGSKYRDPWLLYLTRGKTRIPERLLKDKGFVEASLRVCAPMFWAMAKGRAG